MTPDGKPRRVLGRGRYLTLLDEDGWEYTTRHSASGIVVIVAVTPDDALVLVEQPRVAVHNRVIELPAGLVGDHAGKSDESFADAARRELIEETGFAARDMVAIGEGPIAVGVSDEVISFFRADGLARVGPGGGDDTEDITVHLVPLPELRVFLRRNLDAGLLVDPKIFAGLFLAGRALP